MDRPKKKVIEPKGAPPAAGHYSRVVQFGDLIFLSGLTAKKADGSQLNGTLEEEVSNVLQNMKMILEDVGSGMDKILKMTVILFDMNDFAKMNSIYEKFFPKEAPARTTFQSNINGKVEMDAISSVRVL